MNHFCSQCGQKIQPGDIYCVWCGTKASGNTFKTGTNRTDEDQYSSPSFTKHKISYEKEQVKTICVNCKVLDIKVQSCTIENIQISWTETASWNLSAAQMEDNLQLNEQNNLGFHNIYDFFHSRQYNKVRIRLPKDYSGTLIIQTETGSIDISDLETAVKIELKTTLGHIWAKNISAASFSATGSVGQILLDCVRASNITIENMATATVDCRKINTDTSITVKSATGGIICVIDDDAINYTTRCHSNCGHCNLPEVSGNGPKILTTSTNAGNIDVRFNHAV